MYLDHKDLVQLFYEIENKINFLQDILQQYKETNNYPMQLHYEGKIDAYSDIYEKLAYRASKEEK